MKERKLFLVVAATLIFGGVGGFLIGQKIALEQSIANVQLQNQLLQADNMTTFWKVWQTINSRFVDKSKIDATRAVYGATAGMVQSLGDPYTDFFDPEQAKIFNENVSGSFEGVGMEIGMRDGNLTVIAPLDGTPADAAGIKAGDRILKINGADTSNMSLDTAVSKIRGPRGTTVTLALFRDGWQDTKDFTITRDVIVIKAGKVRIIAPNIIYLKLNNFYDNSTLEFMQMVNKGIQQGGQKMILDLRNNPGGLLQKSVEIAGWFLNKGSTVTIEDFGGKQTEQVEYTNGPSLIKSMPIVVLVNKGTASAAEILAGALHDNRSVQLIGEKTFGKGSVQELDFYPDGSAIKVTIAHWLTPARHQIQDKGLEPDISVKDDPQGTSDPVLQKAIEVIKQR